MEPESRTNAGRHPKRPSWNSALLAGRATLGGATRFGEWALITGGLFLLILAFWLILRLF